MPRFAFAKAPKPNASPAPVQFDVIPFFVNLPGIAVSPLQVSRTAVYSYATPVSCISQDVVTRLGVPVQPAKSKYHQPSLGVCSIGISLFAQMGRLGAPEISDPPDVLDIEVVPSSYLALNFSPKGTAVKLVLGQDFVHPNWTPYLASPNGAVLIRLNHRCKPFP